MDRGYVGVIQLMPRMENQMHKKMENEMETGVTISKLGKS